MSEFKMSDLSYAHQAMLDRAGATQKEAILKKLEEGYEIVRKDIAGTILVRKGFSYFGITISGQVFFT